MLIDEFTRDAEPVEQSEEVDDMAAILLKLEFTKRGLLKVDFGEDEEETLLLFNDVVIIVFVAPSF